MNKLLFFIFFFNIIISCDGQKFSFKQVEYFVFDSSTGNSLLHQCGSRYFPKCTGYWNLDKVSIDLMEMNFKKILKISSSQCCNRGYKVSNLKRYAFQFIGIVVDKARFIYINAFPKSTFDTMPVFVCDGGISYWGVVFNLSKQEFIDLAFNGPPINNKKEED